MSRGRRLLDALLAYYWEGSVTQDKAASLLEMRKETFAELADLRMVEAALQREANRYLVDAFHDAFPECDPQAVRDGSNARRAPASVQYEGRAKCRKADAALITPPNPSLREVVPTQRWPDAEVAAYLKTHPVPVWKRHADPEPGPELELRFTA